MMTADIHKKEEQVWCYYMYCMTLRVVVGMCHTVASENTWYNVLYMQ